MQLFQHAAMQSINFEEDPDGRVAIAKADIACLNLGRCLNDSVILFYTKHLYWKVIPEGCRKKSHIFNSYFLQHFESYRALIRESPDSSHQKRAMRWTKNVDSFSKDYIAIPIHKNSHWVLAIICLPGLVHNSGGVDDSSGADNSNEPDTESSTSSTENLDPRSGSGSKNREASNCANHSTVSSRTGMRSCSQKPKNSKAKVLPCIYFFNSLNSVNVDEDTIAHTLRSFLEIEYLEKKGRRVQFTSENMPMLVVSCPQQTNCTDCGLYMLKVLQLFLENPIPYYGNKIPDMSNWFTERDITELRRGIKRLIMNHEIE